MDSTDAAREIQVSKEKIFKNNNVIRALNPIDLPFIEENLDYYEKVNPFLFIH